MVICYSSHLHCNDDLLVLLVICHNPSAVHLVVSEFETVPEHQSHCSDLLWHAALVMKHAAATQAAGAMLLGCCHSTCSYHMTTMVLSWFYCDTATKLLNRLLCCRCYAAVSISCGPGAQQFSRNKDPILAESLDHYSWHLPASHQKPERPTYLKDVSIYT